MTSDQNFSIQTAQDAVEREPLNYWLWHSLCQSYAKMNDLDGAIDACKVAIKKNVNNPSPLMELSSLYAAKGNYNDAINSYFDLVNIAPGILPMALNTPQNTIIGTSRDEYQS